MSYLSSTFFWIPPTEVYLFARGAARPILLLKIQLTGHRAVNLES